MALQVQKIGVLLFLELGKLPIPLLKVLRVEAHLLCLLPGPLILFYLYLIVKPLQIFALNVRITRRVIYYKSDFLLNLQINNLL